MPDFFASLATAQRIPGLTGGIGARVLLDRAACARLEATAVRCWPTLDPPIVRATTSA